MTSSRRLLLPLGASLTVNLSLSPSFQFRTIITHSGSIDDDDDDRVRCGCREGDSSLPIQSEMVSSFEMF